MEKTQNEFTSSYSAFSLCPECQYDGGHSPVCTTRPALLYHAISELLSKVYGWYNAEVTLEDVQKQQEQMILDLQKIKGLL